MTVYILEEAGPNHGESSVVGVYATLELAKAQRPEADWRAWGNGWSALNLWVTPYEVQRG